MGRRNLEARAMIEGLHVLYETVRRRTEELCAPLSPEDAQIQSMPMASPAKWHLAHTTWFFETFLLSKQLQDYREFHPLYRTLFNSYYEGVGPQHARDRRGLLSRPNLMEVKTYREAVNQSMAKLIPRLDPEGRSVLRLGIEHEMQHQELILTDILHALWNNPSRSAYGASLDETQWKPGVGRDSLPARWLEFGGGVRTIGCSTSHDAERGFVFDNEGPAHSVLLEPFEIAASPVRCGEFLEFTEAGGYQQPEWWLSDGWQTVRREKWEAPLYWEKAGSGSWEVFGLSGQTKLREEDPACPLSFYEADAYARWKGARLPTEQEWEYAALTAPEEFPLPGPVWEWTSSPYRPYPGFEPFQGAFAEYNGKFMCNQMVLRGGSFATPKAHIRPTYRNFFQPETRWQFAGVRLAR